MKNICIAVILTIQMALVMLQTVSIHKDIIYNEL